MEEKWSELAVELSALLEQYQVLLKLSREKKNALVGVDPKALELLVRREEGIIVKMGKIDEKRRNIVDDLAAFYGLSSDQLDLTSLLGHAPELHKDELQQFAQAFETILTELVPLNEANSRLIQQGLNIIQYNLNVMSRNAVGGTYADRGTEDGPVRKSVMLDAKI